MKEKKWILDDIFNYNRYERDFKIGDIVKISINTTEHDSGESFWVIITERSGYVPRFESKTNRYIREESFDTQFKGEVNNRLLNKDFPKLGEIIEFNIGHIITGWDL